MKYSRGFTVIELIVVVLFLAAATTILVIQRNNLSSVHRDTQRKTAINAMYYNLEEVAYKQDQKYPREINDSTLPAMDPNLFKDPSGHEIGSAKSSYRYQPTNCDQDGCASYTLRADLEKEADYVKTSRRK